MQEDRGKLYAIASVSCSPAAFLQSSCILAESVQTLALLRSPVLLLDGCIEMCHDLTSVSLHRCWHAGTQEVIRADTTGPPCRYRPVYENLRGPVDLMVSIIPGFGLPH